MKKHLLFFAAVVIILPLIGKSQANQNLSNLLSPTAVNQSLLPATDNRIDLGSAGKSWRNVYVDGYLYLDGSRFISNPASNVAVGMQAGNVSMTGTQSTFIGSNAGFSASSGSYNTFIGSFAGYLNSTGSENTFVGEAAGNLNSSGVANTFVGRRAGYSNTTGFDNSALGRYALHANQDGSSNTAVGSNALLVSTSGNMNTALGAYTLQANTSGSHNTALGESALWSNTNGMANTASGENALGGNTSGSYNTASGFFTLSANTTGSHNTAFGHGCGSQNDANSYCSFFGYDADQTVSTDFTNSTAIGSQSRMTASNQVRIGNSSVTSIGGYVGWTNISDERMKKDIKQDVPGLRFINKLQPVTYHLDVTHIRDFLRENKTIEAQQKNNDGRIEQAIKDKEKIIYTGFLAQQVAKAADEIGYEFSGIDKPENENSLYGLRYAEFVVPLVKAVQELSKANDEKNARIDAQQKEIDQLKEMFVQLQQQLNNPPVAGRYEQSALSNELSVMSGPALQQNIPNPFSRTTTISYTLPQQFSAAKIIVTDKAGKVLKEVNLPAGRQGLSGSGKGSLNVDASMLSSGAYQYSLYVDGRLVDTKQMVLAK